MPIKIVIENDASAQLRRIQNKVQSARKDGIIQAAKLIATLAAELAPEETGKLKQSGKVRVIGGGDGVEVTFGEDLPDGRARAQEFGTIFQPAQPYLSVAVKEIDIVEEVARHIRAALI